MKYLLVSLSFTGLFILSSQSLTFLSNPVIDAQNSSCTSDTLLFPIWINNRHGFINQKGSVVIEPKYRDLGDFVDGLAPARINGTFGYINTEGVYEIPPVFDFATDFSEGFARVWQDGKLFFIDKMGQKVWDIDMVNAGDFEKGLAHVLIIKDSIRLEKALDTLGQLHDIQEFPQWDMDLTIITIPPHKETEQEQVGVKSKTGKMIVPFGRYKSIEPFHEGLAKVEIKKGYDSETGFINRKGELVFKLKKGMYAFDNYFSEGLLGVETCTIADDFNSTKFTTWLDTTGKVIFEKKQDEEGTPFQTHRSFSGDIRNWYLMDKTGKQLSENRFEWFKNNDFSKNRVLVAYHDTTSRFTENEKWGVIDSMGNYRIPPQYDKVSDTEFQKEGLLVAIADTSTNPKTEDVYTGKSYHWGLIDTMGNWLIKPKFTNVNPKGFQNGLLYVEIDAIYGYVDRTGEFVWQAQKQTPKNKNIRNVEPLNIAYMMRGYYYILPSNYTKNRYQTSADNLCIAKTAQPTLELPEGQIGILAKLNETAIFQNFFKGFKIYVYNTTKDSFDMDVQDNRLYITMQALDNKGIWRDIEYSPSSWCGNSYYSVTLKAHEYWALTVPVYDGDIETTLRFAFSTQREKNQVYKVNQPIYSNTFIGKINPAQFWNKEGHIATNLMDPYNE